MNKTKILIIDDEENFSKLVKKNLERTGEFEVYAASEGSGGVSLARELKPDLILLDLIMPELDGGDVAAMIRQEESLKDTPVVFLTAIVRPGEEAIQSSTGGYKVLPKTVTLGELITFIKTNANKGN